MRMTRYEGSTMPRSPFPSHVLGNLAAYGTEQSRPIESIGAAKSLGPKMQLSVEVPDCTQAGIGVPGIFHFYADAEPLLYT
jgi:hypothetical protein